MAPLVGVDIDGKRKGFDVTVIDHRRVFARRAASRASPSALSHPAAAAVLACRNQVAIAQSAILKCS
jgi:hypothetical protein